MWGGSSANARVTVESVLTATRPSQPQVRLQEAAGSAESAVCGRRLEALLGLWSEDALASTSLLFIKPIKYHGPNSEHSSCFHGTFSSSLQNFRLKWLWPPFCPFDPRDYDLITNPLSIPGFDPWVGKIPWRRERPPTPVFLPGEVHGLYSPWGHKQSHTTEWLSLTHSLLFQYKNQIDSAVIILKHI